MESTRRRNNSHVSIQVLYGVVSVLLLAVLNEEKTSRLSRVLKLRHKNCKHRTKKVIRNLKWLLFSTGIGGYSRPQVSKTVELTIVDLANLLKHIPELLLGGREGVVPDDDLGRRVVRSSRHPSLWFQ